MFYFVDRISRFREEKRFVLGYIVEVYVNIGYLVLFC